MTLQQLQRITTLGQDIISQPSINDRLVKVIAGKH